MAHETLPQPLDEGCEIALELAHHGRRVNVGVARGAEHPLLEIQRRPGYPSDVLVGLTTAAREQGWVIVAVSSWHRDPGETARSRESGRARI